VHIVNANSFVNGPSKEIIRSLPTEDMLVAMIMSDAILRKAKITKKLSKVKINHFKPLEANIGHSKTE
jgi:hypothetical protein